MKRKWIALVLSLILLLSFAATAHASESLDPGRRCSLVLLMDYEGKKLNSGSLTIYQIATVRAHNGWHFNLIPELSGSDITLADLNASGLASSIWTEVQKVNLKGTDAKIEEGKAVFSDLSCGLYLVTQTERQASDKFEPILPFLISLPQQENGKYVYDVMAAPKVGIEPEPTVPPTTRPTGHLPQTGQTNWPVPVMASGGLLLFALGWYLYFGKKEGYET